MTKRLNGAIAQVRQLSATEQNRAAEVLLAFLRGACELEREER